MSNADITAARTWIGNIGKLAEKGKDWASDVSGLAEFANGLGKISGILGFGSAVLSLIVPSERAQIDQELRKISTQIDDLKAESETEFEHLDNLVQFKATAAPLQKACVALNSLNYETSHYEREKVEGHETVSSRTQILAWNLTDNFLQPLGTIKANLAIEDGSPLDNNVFQQLYELTYGQISVIRALSRALTASITSGLKAAIVYKYVVWEEENKLHPDQPQTRQDLEESLFGENGLVTTQFIPLYDLLGRSLSHVVNQCKTQINYNIIAKLDSAAPGSTKTIDGITSLLKELISWNSSGHDWIAVCVNHKSDVENISGIATYSYPKVDRGDIDNFLVIFWAPSTGSASEDVEVFYTAESNGGAWNSALWSNCSGNQIPNGIPSIVFNGWPGEYNWGFALTNSPKRAAMDMSWFWIPFSGNHTHWRIGLF